MTMQATRRTTFLSSFLSVSMAASLLWMPIAHAETPVVSAGVQPSPPAVADSSAAPLTQDLGQRRAIRGCPVGMSCQGPVQEALLEFEREAFPKTSGSSPWVESDSAPTSIRVYGESAGELSDSAQTRVVTKPSQLRPDLPWLDDLQLPDIPVHWDESIIKYLEFYKDDPRGRNIMSAWLRDQEKYRDMMLAKLRSAKLPDALIYISMIESSYDPHEYSRVGASGLWQFMPAAGHIYGLHQDRWLDERNDPIRSTDAVLDYFSDLYDRFGDWDLSLAAFNAGYGAVIKSIAKYNTNSYWQLVRYENGLPWGTSHYVPKFLATAIVGHNLEFFGYDKIDRATPVLVDHVEVPQSVPLAIVAKAAGTNTDTIKHLNPQLRRPRTPPTVSKYRVKIPKGKAALFAEKFPQLREDWDDVDAYVVKHGERFEDIATTFGISRNKLRDMNGIDSEVEVAGGMVLVVPKVDPQVAKANKATADEDLYASGVPEGEPGEALLVPVPDLSLKVEGAKRYFYRVVYGNTQAGVAAAFGVDRFELARWNGLDPEAHLHPRMVIQVWTKPSFDPASAGVAILDEARLRVVEAGSPEHLDEAEERIGRKRVSYQPERPESFETIGKKFGLGKYDLARINHRAPDTIIAPGESILVYQVVDRTESDRAAQQAKDARRNKRKR